MATIVSVASGKGGVGKSVTVSNLGLIAAQRGLRVVLADLDVGGADLHVPFGQFDLTGTLTDFLTRRRSGCLAFRPEAVVVPIALPPGMLRW